MDFNGLYTALVTPFLNDKIDEKGLVENIHFQIQNHVDGLVILGTTGEDPSLSSDEKQSLIKIARQQTSLNLIVGTGSYSTRTTIENSLIAEGMGADALLIIVPYFNKPTQEGIYRHFEAIANKISIPIILYNNFARTSVNMEVSTIERLAQIPSIAGIKECAGDPQFTEIVYKIKSLRPDFAIFTGDDANTFTALSLGADGVISVLSNLIPDQMRGLVTALQSGDIRLARSIHYKLYPLFKAMALETNPIPIKAAMNACAMSAGPCRLPLVSMHGAHLDQLLTVLERIPILSAR